jgi:hypothetical protein
MDDILKKYVPTLAHYKEGDRIEYVTRDCAAVYERVDENLDIIRDMATGTIIGFQLNGWSKHSRDIAKQ